MINNVLCGIICVGRWWKEGLTFIHGNTLLSTSNILLLSWWNLLNLLNSTTRTTLALFVNQGYDTNNYRLKLHISCTKNSSELQCKRTCDDSIELWSSRGVGDHACVEFLKNRRHPDVLCDALSCRIQASAAAPETEAVSRLRERPLCSCLTRCYNKHTRNVQHTKKKSCREFYCSKFVVFIGHMSFMQEYNKAKQKYNKAHIHWQ